MAPLVQLALHLLDDAGVLLKDDVAPQLQGARQSAVLHAGEREGCRRNEHNRCVIPQLASSTLQQGRARACGLQSQIRANRYPNACQKQRSCTVFVCSTVPASRYTDSHSKSSGMRESMLGGPAHWGTSNWQKCGSVQDQPQQTEQNRTKQADLKGSSSSAKVRTRSWGWRWAIRWFTSCIIVSNSSACGKAEGA